MTPQKIGRYEVREELGRGGMATVFLAYDPHFERMVAIKVLPREFLHEPEFRARFVREAKTVAALEHPAIVPVYDFGEDDGQPFLVMRHMPGGSLTDRLVEGPIPIQETARILRRIGSALDQAHKRGIVHRDLKPSNILFDQFGEAYLADFGIVRITSSSAALTASGSLVGTPAYMSPEQVYGDKKLDGRSDIYALGVILFQMLTGGVPFSADTPARMMMKHVMDPVPLIGERRPDLPADYDSVITKAMAKDRAARFPTATELATAVDEATKRTVRPEIAAEQTVEMPEVNLDIEPTEVLPPETQVEPSAKPEPVPTPIAKAPQEFGEQRKGLNVPVWVWAVVVIFVVVCGASIAGASWLIKNDRLSFLGIGSTSTPTRSITPSVEATPSMTRGNDAVVTTETPPGGQETAAALAAIASPTPEPTETDQPIATTEVDSGVEATRASIIAARETQAAETVSATTTPVPAAGGETSLRPLFGPTDGNLEHVVDSFIETHSAGIEVRDFLAQVTFANPFATTTGGWDFGLIFRQAELDEEIRLVVRSDGVWNLNDRRGDTDSFVNEGDVSGFLNLQANDRNRLMVITQGDRGYFFLNDNFMATLDLSARLTAGDISVGTGFYGSSEQEGASTAYTDFTVWPLTAAFGPRTNQLDHVDDGLIKVRGAGVDLVNFMADVSFRNPYATSRAGWDVGFSFRDIGLSDQLWLIVDSNLGWVLIDRSGDEDTFIDDGVLDDLDTSAAGSNRLTLIAIDQTAYFFVNDSFVSQLNLASRMNSGDVEVATAFYVGNEIDGEVTTYEDFTVWALP
jgi:serine/threonine protein kinase